MIKLVERIVCDLCEEEITEYDSGFGCGVCSREICPECKVRFSISGTLVGSVCRRCNETIHEDHAMIEILQKFLKNWAEFSRGPR